MASLLPLLFTVIVMPIAPPCQAPESAVLDFWIGDWDVTWKGGKGHSRVTRSSDGCEIDGEFDDASGKRQGVSLIWPAHEDGWAMTWPGAPLTGGQASPVYEIYFHGRAVGSDYVFEEGAVGTPVYRVLFSDIRKDSFTWHWQVAADRKSWTDKLVARYVRSKP